MTVRDAEIVVWCTQSITGAGARTSNNTVRQRLACVSIFFRWLQQEGFVVHDPGRTLQHLRKQYPALYGKVQDRHPARWLTREEADRLLETCRDGSWIGSRDQLALRFGLLGCRVSDVIGFRWGHWRPDGRFVWIGKGRRNRTITPGPRFATMLDAWKRQYERSLGRPVTSDDPVLCRAHGNSGGSWVLWGTPLGDDGFRMIVRERAEAAGLGWLAPHDLRRSAAGILHNARTPDGGHVYDLLDIQKVLDHSDPATTQRSYISQMSDEVKASAGLALD